MMVGLLKLDHGDAVLKRKRQMTRERNKAQGAQAIATVKLTPYIAAKQTGRWSSMCL